MQAQQKQKFVSFHQAICGQVNSFVFSRNVDNCSVSYKGNINVFKVKILLTILHVGFLCFRSMMPLCSL